MAFFDRRIFSGAVFTVDPAAEYVPVVTVTARWAAPLEVKAAFQSAQVEAVFSAPALEINAAFEVAQVGAVFAAPANVAARWP